MTVMGDALMERLSDAGSIPARSTLGVKENACFYRHFLFLIFLQALSEKLFIETTTIKKPSNGKPFPFSTCVGDFQSFKCSAVRIFKVDRLLSSKRGQHLCGKGPGQLINRAVGVIHMGQPHRFQLFFRM